MASFKERLKSNELVLGSWITIGHPIVAEIMVKTGFDWLTIDTEHSAITLDQAQQLIRVIELSGVVPLVRVGENNPYLIKRVMDAGAYGVIVPMVNSKEDAIRAVQAVKYPPWGTRGVGLARAQGYGFEFERYKDWVVKDSVVVVQIEHIDAVDNLEQILKVEGVDASIIGPYDLSASLGYPGEFQRGEVKKALKIYEDICDKLDKPKGIHVVKPCYREVAKYIEKGYKSIAFSTDSLFLGGGIRRSLEKLTAEIKEIKG